MGSTRTDDEDGGVAVEVHEVTLSVDPGDATGPRRSTEPAADGHQRATATRDEQRWRRLFDDTPLGVLVLSWDGRVVEANRAVLAMLDRPLQEVLGAPLPDFAHHSQHAELDRALLLRTGQTTQQARYLRGDGQELWLRTAASLVVEDGEQRILAICEDVTAACRAQAELAHRADHDELTGLPNRPALRRRVRSDLRRLAAGEADGVGLVFLDLDRFKVINDLLGHAVGDRLLREVATRLRSSVPAADLLARLGGDEFALVTTDPVAAPALAERLFGELQAPFELDGREVTVGASIGVAICDEPPPDGSVVEDDLLRDADTAMYAAKRAGSGPVVVFEESLRRRAVARLEDEQGLRRALQHGELRVHFQPILSLPELEICTYEALVRWAHPERGLLAPGAFLQTAEEAGLVVPLGREVLQRACRQLARWRAEGRHVRVAVNVAAQHLAAGTLVRDVEQALAGAGLQPDALTLEITEQGLVTSHVQAAAVLADLRRQGCQVALDDFGTGYSSLAYLRRLPVDILKIDRTFVAGAGSAGNDAALLSAITALGASLGLQTVTEGIETPEELAVARAAGATHVQGHLLGRPTPA